MENQNPLQPHIDAQERLAWALSYVAFFAPWLLKKHTDFTAFHMKQAFCIQVVGMLLFALLTPIAGFVFLSQMILSGFLGWNAYLWKREMIIGITDKMLDVLVKLGMDKLFNPKK